MPIYEFQCNDCQGAFEEMRRITDETLPVCPSCESTDVRKLISLSAFHLKGTGWYVTDYGGKKNGSDVPAAGEGNGNGGADSKTDGGDNGTGTKAEGETKSAVSATAADAPKAEKPKSGGQSTPSN